MNDLKEKEIWKEIKDYEGLYEISNLGNVRTFKSKKKIKPVEQSAHKYYTVALSKGKKRTTYLIHRLVAQAFVPNPQNYNEINHKDKDTHNNIYSNLEWCTHTWNMNHYWNNNARVAQYSKTGDFIAEYIDMDAVMLKYPDYNRTNVNMNLNGMTKSAYGFVWKYIHTEENADS